MEAGQSLFKSESLEQIHGVLTVRPKKKKTWKDDKSYSTVVNRRKIEAFERAMLLIDQCGPANCVMVTMTRKKPAYLDIGRYSKDWSNWYNSFLRKKYGSEYIRVLEQQKNGRLHFHILLNFGMNVVEHFDRSKGKFKRGKAHDHVTKRVREFIKSTSKKDYGFGRIHVAPIIYTESRFAAYLSKSIGSKMIIHGTVKNAQRFTCGKGVPKFKDGKWDPTYTYFRIGLKYWAIQEGFEEDDFEAIQKKYGRGWRWLHMHAIMELGFENLDSRKVTAFHNISH